MRFLFTTQPAYGHFHPLAPLAHALRDAGHEILVATGASFGREVARSGLEVVAAGIDWQETHGGLVKAFPELMNHPGTVAGNRFVFSSIYGGDTARATARDLLAVIRSWQPDLLVRGTFEYGSVIAAEVTGLPFVTVQVGANAVAEVNRESLKQGLTAAAREFGVELTEDLSILHRHLLLSFVPECFQDARFPLPPTARAFRAPVVDSYDPGRPPQWLQRMPEERTVYMSMGTVFTRLLGPFEKAIEALAGEPVNLIITVGHQNDPESFGPVPDNVRIERYVPNSILLPHTDLVVCHGGFNTVLSALAHGIPLVLLPVSADQPDNCARCALLGVAEVLDWESFYPHDLRAAVRRLLTEPSYVREARRVQEQIRAMPGIDVAVKQLEELAAA